MFEVLQLLLMARFIIDPGECEMKWGQGQDRWIREARVMKIVKQRLKPPKTKRGRTGNSVDAAQGAGEGTV